MDLPPSSHFIYIPVILILGLVLGFILGAKATRDAFALDAKRAAEREARRAARAAKATAAAARPDEAAGSGITSASGPPPRDNG